MKKIKVLLMLALSFSFFFSCSQSEKEIVDEISGKMCNLITQNPSSSSVAKAQTLMNEEIAKLKTRERLFIESDILKSFENCIKSLKFSKNIPAERLIYKISGNASTYLAIKDTSYSITLSPHENPVFFINLVFSAREIYKKYNDSIEIKGTIELIDKSGQLITSHNIYTTPDLKRILKTGSGEAVIKTYLSPVWTSLSKEPIKTALTGFEQIERTESFRINLTISDNSQFCPRIDKKTEKEYEDLLDKLDKKN